MKLPKQLRNASIIAFNMHRHLNEGDEGAARCAAKYLHESLTLALLRLNNLRERIDPAVAAEAQRPVSFTNGRKRFARTESTDE